MFFVHAEITLDNDAELIIESNRVYLKSFDEKILIDLHYDQLEYTVTVLNDIYLVNGFSDVLGGTGRHYKVYVIDAHGKVWHSNEFEAHIDINDETIIVSSDDDSISYSIEDILTELRDEGANFKIDLIYDEGLTTSEAVNFKNNNEFIYLAFEIKSAPINKTMCLLFVKLDHQLNILNMSMGGYNDDMESMLD